MDANQVLDIFYLADCELADPKPESWGALESALLEFLPEYKQPMQLRDSIIVSVIGGLVSRHDHENMPPDFVADYAVTIADSVIKKLEAKK